MADEEPLLTSGEVAQRLGIARRTVTAWVQQGILTPKRKTAGGLSRRGRSLFLWSEVEAQLKAWQQQGET